MYETTRLFLERVLPWPAAPSESGPYINIHRLKKFPKGDRPVMIGDACLTVDECIAVIHRQSRDPTNLDFYVCMSSQRECELRESRYAGGKAWRKAKRHQDDVHEIRSLFVDMDVRGDDAHKDAPYADTGEAAAALQTFLDQANIPSPSLFVLTGSGGFHCHWVLSAPVGRSEWQVLAEALQNATVRHGLQVDPSVTTDSARVMRLPETRNSKAGNKLAELLPVQGRNYTVEEMQAYLAPYMGAKVVPIRQGQNYPRGNPLTGMNAALAGGIPDQRKLIDVVTMAEAGCGFVKEALITGGAGFSEILWRDTCRIALFTEGGLDDAHLMSNEHPNYTVEETHEKFEQVKAYQEKNDLGWPQCDTIAKHGCTNCATCQLYEPGANKSPLHYGKTSFEQPDEVAALQLPIVQDNELPPPYVRNEKGWVCYIDRTKKPPMIEAICPYWIGNAMIQEKPHWAFNFTARVHEDDKETNISIPSGVLNHKFKFVEFLADRGIMLKGPEKENTQMFLVSWHQQLQKIKGRIMQAQPFGWVHDDKGAVAGFSYGGTRYEPGRQVKSGSIDPVLSDLYRPRGDLEEWKRAARMVTDLSSPEREVLMATAFAGPLVNFTGENGLLVSGYSNESGIGKTASLRIGLAVWGHSRKALNGTKDTANSLAQKMGQLQHLPIFWDELKDEDAKKRFSTFVWNVTQGSERNRLKADLTQSESGDWKTMLAIANNDSVVEMLNSMNRSTVAGSQRVFEFPIPSWEEGQQRLTVDQATQLIGSTEQNFGKAGEVYAEYLGENHELIADNVKQWMAYLSSDYAVKPEQRFWLCTSACIMLGAMYANHLGLTNFNMLLMGQFLKRAFINMADEVKQSPNNFANAQTVLNHLGHYLSDMRGHNTLITEQMHSGAGRPTNTVKDIAGMATAKLDHGLFVHTSKRPPMIVISASHFREYFTRKNISPNTLITAMQKQWDVKLTNRVLGAGTEFATKRIQVLELDCTHEDLRPLMDD